MLDGAAEALLGRPFEHAQALKTALDQQRAINDAIQAAADRAGETVSDEDALATATSDEAGPDVEMHETDALLVTASND